MDVILRFPLEPRTSKDHSHEGMVLREKILELIVTHIIVFIILNKCLSHVLESRA